MINIIGKVLDGMSKHTFFDLAAKHGMYDTLMKYNIRTYIHTKFKQDIASNHVSKCYTNEVLNGCTYVDVPLGYPKRVPCTVQLMTSHKCICMYVRMYVHTSHVRTYIRMLYMV